METPTLRTRLTERFGVPHPFVCAGMAFVGTPPDLCIATCRAGAIGSIAVGPLPEAAVRGLVRAVRAATHRPFHVNFITFLAEDAQIQACIEEQAPIVSFHWGHPPRRWIDALHRAGVQVWEQVGSPEDAARAVGDGADLVVAQGSEAGGHNRGSLPTLALVPEVIDAVSPALVLAAGGIADGRQVAAALALGADGVWVGTRMVATAEAHAHPEYKRRLVEAAGAATRLSSLFGPEMPHFNPMRVLGNRILQEHPDDRPRTPSGTPSPVIGTTSLLGDCIALHRYSSFVPMPGTEGDLDEMALPAGQGVGMIKDVRPVGEVIEEMMEQARRTLQQFAP